MASMAREVTKAMALSLSRKARSLRSARFACIASVLMPLIAPQEEAATAMRRARAAQRAAALRAELVALRAEAAGGGASGDAATAMQRALRNAEPAPLWPPAERARLLRARQWACILASSPDTPLAGWCVARKRCAPNLPRFWC
jgi:hypothetical protein